MSIDSCGTSCERCPAPPNGTATCNGQSCDFRCDVGRKCGNACVADEEPCNGACGSGRALCMGSGKCVPTNSITAEKCDGQDNDCDGQIDEGVTDSCQNKCGTKGTMRCVNGGWDRSGCPSDPGCCGDNDCSGSQECSGGNCRGLSCNECQNATGHRCQNKSSGTPCSGTNRACNGSGSCVTTCGTVGADCCAGTPCQGNAYCDNGGKCRAEKGNGSSCSDGQECSSGNCVTGQSGRVCCKSSSCESGSVCNGSGDCKRLKGEPCGPTATYSSSDGNVCLSGKCRGYCSTSTGRCTAASQCPASSDPSSPAECFFDARECE
jgi:hypothetical protein